MRREGKEHASSSRTEMNSNDSARLRRIDLKRSRIGTRYQGHPNAVNIVVNEIGGAWLSQVNHQRHSTIGIDTLTRRGHSGVFYPPNGIHILAQGKCWFVER